MIKIAVIEDEASIAEMYEFKLKAAGYDARHAVNGVDGLKLLEEFQPELVLLDLMMPGMTGQEVLQKVRATDWGKTVKVIVLTNVNTEEAPDELNALDISRYIIKAQTTPQQILEMVQEVLARSKD
jgi:DNA-binding response OmpR family regulator